MKNLILGFATNQTPDSLEIFLRSARTVYDKAQCDLTLIVNKSDDIAIARDIEVEFFRTTNIYPHKSVLARKARSMALRLGGAVAHMGLPVVSSLAQRWLHDLIERWHHPHFARWVAYRRYLARHPEYDKVFLTDVRDVLFQGRFFEDADCETVQLFEQDQNYGDDNCDSDWYRDAWGPEALTRISGNPSVCIGTILGKRADIMKLIDGFVGYYSRTPFCGVEQAIFNRFLREGNPDFPFSINRNIEHAVATLSRAEVLDKLRVTDRIILRADDSTIPVVHMYDRFDVTDRPAQQYRA